jgi:hypothetical protein
MIEHFSFEEAKKLWHFTSTEAMALIDDITEKYGLDVQRKRGHLDGCGTPRTFRCTA